LIWDIFFLEGTPTLFKTIIIILEKHKDTLLKITQIDKLVNSFDSVHNLSLLNQNKKELLVELLKYNKKINNNLIMKGRKKWYKKVKDSMKNLKSKFTNNKILDCSPEWDNCSYIKKKFDADDFIIYTTNEKMEKIEHYYQNKKRNNSFKVKNNKKKFNEIMNEFPEYNYVMIQRRVHECPNGIKKKIKEKMKSSKNLDENIIKSIIEGNYIFKKDIKVNNNVINNKNSEDEVDDDFEDSYNTYLFSYFD
jgi:guanylate kinase